MRRIVGHAFSISRRNRAFEVLPSRLFSRHQLVIFRISPSQFATTAEAECRTDSVNLLQPHIAKRDLPGRLELDSNLSRPVVRRLRIVVNHYRHRRAVDDVNLDRATRNNRYPFQSLISDQVLQRRWIANGAQVAARSITIAFADEAATNFDAHRSVFRLGLAGVHRRRPEVGLRPRRHPFEIHRAVVVGDAGTMLASQGMLVLLRY